MLTISNRRWNIW